MNIRHVAHLIIVISVFAHITASAKPADASSDVTQLEEYRRQNIEQIMATFWKFLEDHIAWKKAPNKAIAVQKDQMQEALRLWTLYETATADYVQYRNRYWDYRVSLASAHEKGKTKEAQKLKEGWLQFCEPDWRAGAKTDPVQEAARQRAILASRDTEELQKFGRAYQAYRNACLGITTNADQTTSEKRPAPASPQVPQTPSLQKPLAQTPGLASSSPLALSRKILSDADAYVELTLSKFPKRMADELRTRMNLLHAKYKASARRFDLDPDEVAMLQRLEGAEKAEFLRMIREARLKIIALDATIAEHPIAKAPLNSWVRVTVAPIPKPVEPGNTVTLTVRCQNISAYNLTLDSLKLGPLKQGARTTLEAMTPEKVEALPVKGVVERTFRMSVPPLTGMDAVDQRFVYDEICNGIELVARASVHYLGFVKKGEVARHRVKVAVDEKQLDPMLAVEYANVEPKSVKPGESFRVKFKVTAAVKASMTAVRLLSPILVSQKLKPYVTCKWTWKPLPPDRMIIDKIAQATWTESLFLASALPLSIGGEQAMTTAGSLVDGQSAFESLRFAKEFFREWNNPKQYIEAKAVVTLSDKTPGGEYELNFGAICSYGYETKYGSKHCSVILPGKVICKIVGSKESGFEKMTYKIMYQEAAEVDVKRIVRLLKEKGMSPHLDADSGPGTSVIKWPERDEDGDIQRINLEPGRWKETLNSNGPSVAQRGVRTVTAHMSKRKEVVKLLKILEAEYGNKWMARVYRNQRNHENITLWLW